ncbi:MAG: hypothetical protein B7Y93_04210 [Micrococcales bacterium 32-70-13]|nr:MAG: hypothetical protein B7Y93_04210 [Micrococcales bacterium 32-70-13]
MGIVLAPQAAPAVTHSAPATAVAPAAGAAIELVAAPAASGIIRPGEPVSVRVTVTSTGDEPTGPIEVALAIDGTRAADAQQLATWFDGGTIEADDRAVASATLSSLEPGASAVLDLIVPEADSVVAGAFGPRLATVRAALTEAETDEPAVADRTALVWVPDSGAVPVAGTSFVAAIATPGEPGAFLDAATLERYTSEAGALSRTLDAVAGRPVLLAIDPRIIASTRLLGAAAPASATAFLQRLQAAPNESFLLPWADADAAAAIAATGTPLPRPEGAGVPAAEAGTEQGTPSPSPSPEQSRALDELTAWPATLGGVDWLAAGTLTAEAVGVLAEQGTGVILAPGSSLAERAPVQLIDGVRVLRAHDALSAAARDAAHSVSQQRFDDAMARVSALLAADAQAETGIPALIALSRDRLAGSDRLLDTIAQTVALPWAAGTTASAMLERTAVPSAVAEPALDEVRLEAVRAALSAEAEDRVFATIAVTPEAITDIRRLDLLSALSVGWGDRSPEALQAFTTESAALRSSVQVVESSAITLLADRASLPVTVQNDLGVAVRVFVRVEPDTAQLRVVDPRVETLVEPLSQTRALVPVESLTNGQVDITVTVQDAESRPIGTPTRVSLNLQAGWETAGTIAVAVALVLLLTVGITRDIRKRRRARESP